MQADGPAERDAGVGEPVDAERVGEREHQAGQLADGRARTDEVGGGVAVAGEVPAYDPVRDGQFGRDGVPQGGGGAERRAEEQGRGGGRAFRAVVEQPAVRGGARCAGQGRSRARSVRIPAAPV
ncbi:hypothetical protein GCM10018785_23820 [Streptomyces longispororuber]|uniref:Uncharacterized protein n=1 Tax=Streptomyces longispororuber TaxID=68230 RepID=A0A918ZHQ8_9ACTN|nr:hypothetical protein GCM10018785_23820 [Streptomyces longispororuber]